MIDADFTIESVIALGYREVSEILHIDTYAGKLIVEAAQSVMQSSLTSIIVSKYDVDHIIGMMSQQRLLTQNLTVPQILRTHGKQFRQILSHFTV